MSGEEADVPVVDAREVVRQYREQLAVYLQMPPMPSARSTRATRRPRRRKVALDQVPESLQQLVSDYERRNPGTRLVPVALFSSGEGQESALAAGSLLELPDEDSIVCFSVTETTLSADSAQVRTQTLVAERTKSG